ARQAQRDGDGRQLDVREILNRQLHEAPDAGHREHDEEDDRRNRIPDRPRREVHCALPATGSVRATRTTSPSLRNPAPCATMRSPSATPSRISTRSPMRLPTCTWRATTFAT